MAMVATLMAPPSRTCRSTALLLFRCAESRAAIILPQNARGRNHETGFQHCAPIDEGRGIAGDENEDLGGVAEAVVAQREPGQNAGRQVIDEDQPQREPAEQIEAQLTLAHGGKRNRGRTRGRPHGGLLCGRALRSGNRGGGLIGNGRHRTPFQGRQSARTQEK